MKQKKGMELVTERTVDGFRRELLRREYSRGTAESYVRSIRAFARWSGGAVDRGLVLTWKARLTARYAPATVNAMLAGLNRFFDFAGRPECRVKVLRLQRRSFREAERELDRGEYRALVRTARTLGRERLALVMSCQLPVLSLLPLIENVIKHNEISARNPMRLSIYSTHEPSLVILNRKQPKLDEVEKVGIGLKNLDNRFALLVKKRIRIEDTDEFFRVSLPLKS